MGDRRQQRDERDRAGQQDALPQSVLDERQVVLQRGAEERFARQEHHDHLRRVAERLPVALAAELVHVVAHLPRVRLQLRRARASSSATSCASRNASSGALASTTICLPPGRWTIRSGRRRPLSREERRLLVEVAALQHAGDLDDAPELHLAPAAAHRRRPQGARQRAGRGAERRDLLGEPAVGGNAIALRFCQPGSTFFSVSAIGW